MKMIRIKGRLIIGLIVCLLAGCNRITPIVQDNSMENMKKPIMKAAPFEYSFQLDGYQYALPVKVDRFVTNGWKLDQTGTLEGGKSKVVGLEKGGNSIEITIQNLRNNKGEYQSCETKGISVKRKEISDDSTFTIFDEIKIGMSQEELESKIKDLYYLVSYTDNGGTDYQILDDIYFQEGYGYLISTNNGLVTSININYLADGNREERTDEITNHWRNDPVKNTEADTIIPVEFNCIYEADINKDGKKDKIDFKFLDYNDGSLLTVVNGMVNIIRSDTTVKAAYLIPRSNGSCALLLDLDESDNYSPCCIYQILDTRCIETAEIKGSVEKNTLKENGVTLKSYPYVIGAGWSAETDYKITEAFNLIPASESRLKDIENRKGIKVKKMINATFFDNYGHSYKSELKPGDTIKLTETDFQSVLKFSMENGITGKIQITQGEEQNCCFLYYHGENLTNYFDKDSLIFAG